MVDLDALLSDDDDEPAADAATPAPRASGGSSQPDSARQVQHLEKVLAARDAEISKMKVSLEEERASEM